MAEENRNQDGREERELQPAAHTPGDIPMEAAPVPNGEDAVRTETATGADAARGRTAAVSRKTARKRHSAGKTAQKKERAGAGKKKEGGLGLQRRHRGVRVRVPCVRVSAWALDV